MPELPEVEVARRNLLRWFKGRRLLKAHAERARTFRHGSPKAFEQLHGKLLSAERRGKYLLLTFEHGGGLMAHLGMTGKFVRRPRPEAEPYSKAQLELDDGEVIHFRDPRLFGQLSAMPADRLRQVAAVRKLGPDPLVDGLDAATLKERIGRSRQALKVALMDQSRVAGLGNLHAAEALFRAHLHPARKPGSLSDAEWKTLARAIHQTLKFGIATTEAEEVQYVEEGEIPNPFFVYGRGQKPCRRCRTPIATLAQGGRTTYYCPRCQPSPRRESGRRRS